MSRPAPHTRIRHQLVAEQAREAGGEWVQAGVYRSRHVAVGVANAVRTAYRQLAPAYSPAGAFDARTARHVDGTALWVRYQGVAR